MHLSFSSFPLFDQPCTSLMVHHEFCRLSLKNLPHRGIPGAGVNPSRKTSATPACLPMTCEPHKYGGYPQTRYTGTGHLPHTHPQAVPPWRMFCRNNSRMYSMPTDRPLGSICVPPTVPGMTPARIRAVFKVARWFP